MLRLQPAEALEMMEVAWESGNKTLSTLMLGSRVITGAYHRPVTTVQCDKCHHTQDYDLDDVEWLRYV